MVSKICGVTDASFFDDCSIDKTSNYTVKKGNPSITYNQGYITINSPNNSECIVAPSVTLDSSKDWSMELEIKSTSTVVVACHLGKSSTDTISHCLYCQGYYGYASYNYPYVGDSNWLFKDTGIYGIPNTWYKFKMELKNNILYYYLYDDADTLLKSKTINLPSKYQNSNLFFGAYNINQAASSSSSFRNYLIKPL